MKKYSVLILYPDYVAENYGQDTYLAHVKAKSVKQATRMAQVEASEQTSDNGDCASNYLPLLVTEGHIEDLNPGVVSIRDRKLVSY